MRERKLAIAVGIALFAPAATVVAQTPELDQIRQEIRSLKDSYESRIRALEARLKAAETAAGQAEATAAKAETAARAAAETNAAARDAAAVPGGAGQPAQNAFNPAISLILQGSWGRYGHDPSSRITGFAASGGEVSPPRGASLGESELVISGNIDPYFRGMLLAALTPENEVAVEEGYVETTALGQGFTARGGRFFSGVGYQNSLHPHAWDFADPALAQRAFLGANYGDDGLQLRWVAPLPVFVEVGAEIGRGREFAGAGDVSRTPQRNGQDSQGFFVHVGGDIGDSHSYQLGASHLRQRSGAQGVALFDYDDLSGVANLFAGRQRIDGLELVYKWAPDGNPRYRNVKFVAEWFQRRLDGDFTFNTAGAATLAPLSARQSGWYAQAVYQFHPYWRVGARLDQLSHGSVNLDANAASITPPGFDPKRLSAMIDFNPSEYSRIRLQFSRDRSRLDAATGEALSDNQVFLQYIHSLGAHGAHRF